MEELKQEQKSDRLYWLKLKKDFFKRHDVKVVEAMENGKDYVLFYLKLLCESLDHNGNLRFSDTIPYNENMLSAITGTNVDVVRSAMKIFIDLNLIEVYEDKTIYMREVEKMAGSESKWAELKRNQRAQIGQCPSNVQQLSENVQQSIENRVNRIEYIIAPQLKINNMLIKRACEGESACACNGNFIAQERELCKQLFHTDEMVDITLEALEELGLQPDNFSKGFFGLLITRVYTGKPRNAVQYIQAIIDSEQSKKD